MNTQAWWALWRGSQMHTNTKADENAPPAPSNTHGYPKREEAAMCCKVPQFIWWAAQDGVDGGHSYSVLFSLL